MQKQRQTRCLSKFDYLCLCVLGISITAAAVAEKKNLQRGCQYLNETTPKCNNSHQNMMIGNQTAGNRLKRSNYSCNFDCNRMTAVANDSSNHIHKHALITMSLPNYWMHAELFFCLFLASC